MVFSVRELCSIELGILGCAIVINAATDHVPPLSTDKTNQNTELVNNQPIRSLDYLVMLATVSRTDSAMLPTFQSPRRVLLA